jgi:hypothetical protein
MVLAPASGVRHAHALQRRRAACFGKIDREREGRRFRGTWL